MTKTSQSKHVLSTSAKLRADYLATAKIETYARYDPNSADGLLKMHRCSVCWLAGNGDNNGFIPATQPYPHMDYCPLFKEAS